MGLVKRTYTDGSTIITAANLNAIQDSIIALEQLQITEFGTSGEWTYRKWNDGTAEAWLRRDETVNITTASGALYVSSASSVNYPFTFTEEPVVTMTAAAESGGADNLIGIISASSSSPLTRSPRYRYFKTVSGSSITARIHVYVKGKIG